MLVLTRKPQQRIRIADDIEIVLLEVRGGRAKIGIECPAAIPVLRAELVGRTVDLPEELALAHCAVH